MIMDGFKLLAIRPLEGCNPDYCKILLPTKPLLPDMYICI